MTDANELIVSLRTMRSSARRHHDGAGGKVRWSVVLDAQWIGDLTDAADLIKRQSADLDKAKAPAVLLTDDAADAVIDGMGWDLDLMEHADMRRLVRAAELAVLAANGKAVTR